MERRSFARAEANTVGTSFEGNPNGGPCQSPPALPVRSEVKGSSVEQPGRGLSARSLLHTYLLEAISRTERPRA